MAESDAVKSGEKPTHPGLDQKSVIKGFGLCSFGAGSGAGVVDVRNGRITRIRPLHFDTSYSQEEIGAWQITARGKTFGPGYKSALSPLALCYKKRVYSPNRLLYPLKRIDWDPAGERNPQNRGASEFVRISWDEALDLIVCEIKRIKEIYGTHAILLQGDGHGETKIVHGPHGCQGRLLDLLGGYTLQTRNPDSWEGWYWGAKHVWGMEEWAGLMWPQTNCFKDVAANSDMILFWGCDPETNTWGFDGQLMSRMSYWFTDLGIKSVYICPDLNYGAAVHADKWIPVRPNTDAALHLAIAYTWMTEGIFDQAYVDTHCYGFDQFKAYVLGDSDGITKDPEWAAAICGVPSWTIKALARNWAALSTTIAHVCGGSLIRSAYATEPARLEVLLLAMQGIGKPGRHQLLMDNFGMPKAAFQPGLWAAYRGLNTKSGLPKQIIVKTLVPEAILNPPISWYGTPLHTDPVESQFDQYTYPVPGCPEIHMIWTDSPCWITCWNGGNRMIEALRSPKIEFVLAQHPWLENDCLFADLVLPVNTKLEEEDIGSEVGSSQFTSIFLEKKCIEPLGESRSDYEIVCMIAERLGLGEAYTEGKTIEQWIRFGFETSGAQAHLSFETLEEKGYFVVPTDPNWQQSPAL